MSEAARRLTQLHRRGLRPPGISADLRQVAASEVFVAVPGKWRVAA